MKQNFIFLFYVWQPLSAETKTSSNANERQSNYNKRNQETIEKLTKN